MSDGGKPEPPTCVLKVPYILRSPEKKRVCAWKYLSLVLGHADHADKWLCLCLDVFLELNMSARGCGGSSSSLPGTPGGEAGQANNVLSWAVSFEKLLEDPYGVRQFTVRHAQHTWRYFVFGINSSDVFLATSQGLPYVLIQCLCLYLQSFLMSEVSAENILFWQACEKFRKISASSLDEVWWHFWPLYMVKHVTCHLWFIMLVCVYSA